MSRGLPKLREAIAGYYQTTWGVELDPELEITNTIGSKEGFSHLMWVLLDRGDAAIVPSPSYPIHIYGPLFAGADLRQVPMRSLAHPEEREGFAEEFFDRLTAAYDIGWPKPRVLVLSFPHNPTGAVVDLPFMQRVVDFCREREMIAVHDFAYADVGFDGYRPPSILQAEGAKECAVELYSMTKSFSMAGWRCAFLLGNAEVVQALVKLKSYLDYGMFQPVQIAATVTINEAADFPAGGLRDLPEPARRADRRARPHRLGRSPSRAARCSCGRRSPSRTPRWTRSSSARWSCATPTSRCRPGVGFGPGGEGFARFALIENEKRIAQGIRNLRKGLPKLGLSGRSRSRHTHGDTPAATASVRSALDERRRCRRPSTPARWSCGSGCPTGRARSGQVASRIGAVHGDVTAIDILERGGGRVDRRARRVAARVGVASTCWPRRSAPSTAWPSSTSASSTTSEPTRRPPCCNWPRTSPRRRPADRLRTLVERAGPGRRCRLGGRRAGLRARRAARHAARPRLAARVPRRQRAPRPGVPGDQHARRRDVGPPAHRTDRGGDGPAARAVHERERQRIATLARIVDHLV